MLADYGILKAMLKQVIACKAAQGCEVAGLQRELDKLPDSYDALDAFAHKIEQAPPRADWPYVEPSDFEGVFAACDPDRPTGLIGSIGPAEAEARARSAFLSAVAGCMLGKPLEIDPTLAEIRAAAEAVGQWPLDDYISDELLTAIGRRHPDSPETMRGHIRHVAPDDDINYTVLGMLVLERHGLEFTQADLSRLWLRNLPLGYTWGPERTTLLKIGIDSLAGTNLVETGTKIAAADWAASWNPKDEACGAAIRADAYGYACPGQPQKAAELAWRDAHMTHRRTGIYGTMYVAAAIAAAFTAGEPLDIFETAQKYVPQNSRFFEIVSDALAMVRAADDWTAGYRAINDKYGRYRHCQIYQETALLINSAAFADSVEQAICMQVASGADTDCYGEIIGSIMGAYFEPGNLPSRWIEPFNDRLHTALADFHEQSLSAVADRMGKLSRLTLT